MPITYSPHDIFIVQRNATSSSFEEVVLTSAPNSYVAFNSASKLISIPEGSLTFQSASHAILADSASHLIPGNNIYLSHSYIIANISSSAPSKLEGQLWWDSQNHTYTIDTDVSRLQIGQENYIRAQAGEFIPDGAAVYISGVTLTGTPIVNLAIADGDRVKFKVIGISTQELNIGEEGFITTAGSVNNINTFAFTNGEILYLSDSQSGSYQNTKPSHPAEEVIVGIVAYAHPSIGKILVNNTIHPPDYPFVGPEEEPLISCTGSNSGSILNIGGIGVHLCETTDGLGTINHYHVSASSFIVTSSFLDVQYLLINYNSGSPIYEIQTDLSTIDDIQIVPVSTFTVGATGALSYSSWDASGIMLANKQHHRIIDLYGAQRASGLLLSTSASHIQISSGTGYIGIKQLTFSTSSTEHSGQFVLLSHSASVWSGSLINGWINDRYDDGTNLQPAGNNKYIVNYVYRGIGSLNKSQIILGSQYTSYADAVESSIPAPPSELQNISILVGRIITQEGNGVLLVESAFTTILSVAGITNHNLLNNLQGGATNDYYHLTSTEHTQIQSGIFPSSSYLIPGNPLHLSNSYIQSSPSMSAPPWKEGRLFWDNVHHTYALYNDIPGVSLQLGQENFLHITAGEDITDARAVYISGSIQDPDNPTNNLPVVYNSIADITFGTDVIRVVGLSTHAISSGSIGWITTNGIVHSVNTSTFNSGDVLYLSPTTPGYYQNVDPGQPYSTVEIGTVLNSDVSNGSILVSIFAPPASSLAYAGMTSIPTLTNNGDGSVTISSGSANLFDNAEGTGVVTSYLLEEFTVYVVPDDTNYIVAERSGSGARYSFTTDSTLANGINIIRVFTIDVYTGNPPGSEWDIHSYNVGIVGAGLANRSDNKDVKLYGFQRADGLTLYTTGSTGQFGITEGTIWYGSNESVVLEMNTTLPGHYTYVFQTTGSEEGWTRYTSSTFLNGYYDSGTGLVPLTTGYYTVNFVYRLIGTSDEAAIVMSSAEFTTSIEASNNAVTPANLPSTVRDMGLLVGRFVVQSGSSSPIIESAFSNTFIPAVVTNHESLLGLQGGTGGEHYHLTLADSTGIGTGVMVRQTNATLNNPSFGGATTYHVPYWKNNKLTLTGSVQVYQDQYVLINSASVDVTYPEALLVKQINSSSVNLMGGYGDLNNYLQLNIQNLNAGISASSDLIVTANNGTQDTFYGDLGIASSNYNDSRWPIIAPNDTYLYSEGGNLLIGTTTVGKTIKFFVDGPTTSSVRGIINSSGFQISGSLMGTSSWANTSLLAISSNQATSASWASSSISSSNAITSSYTIGVPTIKSGIIAGTSFGGLTSKTASVIFGNAFPNNNYSIIVTGESSRTWTIQEKSSSRFEINSNSSVAFTNNVFWQAIAVGEFYS